MQTLLSIKDIENIDGRRKRWDDQIDEILEKGFETDKLTDDALLLDDHDYFQCSTSDYVLAYVAGFVVRKSNTFARLKERHGTAQNQDLLCQDCIATLKISANEKVPESLVKMRNRGALFEPSITLFNLISTLERFVLDVVNNKSINPETIFDVTAAVENLAALLLVGCEEHTVPLIHQIVAFYLTIRMFFVAKQTNKNNCIEKEKTREKRKLSKLSASPSDPNEVGLLEAGPDGVTIKKRKTKQTTEKSSNTAKKAKPIKRKSNDTVSNNNAPKKAKPAKRKSNDTIPSNSKRAKKSTIILDAIINNFLHEFINEAHCFL